MNIFAIRMKQLRKEKGWTQEEFAKRLGITRSAVANYEQGLREPDFESLENIADTLNCDMDFLLGRPRMDLSLDERYLIEAARTSQQIREKLVQYAKFLLQEEKL